MMMVPRYVMFILYYHVATGIDLRLVGNEYAGRLEVFHSGVWGTVCDDYFNKNNAIVVCREIGYSTLNPRFYGSAHYGQGSGQIWMDDVACTGQEHNFFDCNFRGWGENNCGHREDVSVDCNVNAIRLVAGPFPWAGRLEIFHGTWGTVCDDEFGIEEAKVSCRILGYPTNYVQYYSSAYYQQGSGTIYLDDLRCNGQETDLARCGNRGWAVNDCGHNEDASVACLNVRLVNGRNAYEGRLEVVNGGQWNTVCIQDVNIEVARSICSLLGLDTTFPQIYDSQRYGQGTAPHLNIKLVLSKYIKPYKQTNATCEHDDDAGISCVSRTIQLANGTDLWEGRVEVLYGNKWNSICDDNFTQADADKICTILGYNMTQVDAIPILDGQFGSSKSFRHLLNVDCITSQGTLSGCRWTRSSCRRGKEVGVICKSRIKPHLRLRDGGHSMEGRLEIQYNAEWYTVCDDFMTDADATAICNMLSTYPLSRQVKGTVLRDGIFGPGTGKIVTTTIPCRGWGFTDCFFPWQFEARCDHLHDVGVSCAVNTTVSLKGGHNSFTPEGTVQVSFNESLFTVCDDGFESEDAKVICRKLEYWSSSPTTFYNGWFGRGNGQAQDIDPDCDGNEADILFCRTKYSWGKQQCGHSHDVGVACTTTPIGLYVRSTAKVIYGREKPRKKEKPGRDNLRIIPNGQVGKGLLEVMYNGHWGSFCWNHWNPNNNQVVCKTLQYRSRNPRSYSVHGNTSPMTIGNLGCHGYESDIGMCTGDLNKTDCSRAVGIDCTDGIYIKLSDDASKWDGRVHIFKDGGFCSLPDEGDDANLINAEVICTMLGYRHANFSIQKSSSTVQQDLAIQDLHCSGWEEHINQCQYTGFGYQDSKTIEVNCFPCISTFTTVAGELSSPNYPGDYHGNTDCLYIIQPTDRRHYKLVFRDIDLADPGDFIEIRDKYRQIIFIRKGHGVPILTGSVFLIRFKTNSQYNAKGFFLRWNELSLEDTATVNCNQTNWDIRVNMTLLWTLYPSSEVRNIWLSDSNCKGHIVDDEIVFTNLYSNCHTSTVVSQNATTYVSRIKDSVKKWFIPVRCSVL